MNKIFTLFLIAFISVGAFAQLNSNLIVGGNNQLNGQSEYLGPLDNTQIYWEGGEYAAFAQVPLISGSNLVVARRTAANSSAEANIICYNVYTGIELWNTQLPASSTSNEYDKIKAINDGVVYCTRANGITMPATLIALSLADGSLLWESADVIMPSQTESVSFNSNGDIIVIKDHYGYKCFSKVDGSTLWTLDKAIASGGYCSTMAVSGDVGYYYDRAASHATIITACDLTTGDSLRSSNAIMYGDAYTQQNMSIAINIDGTIVAHTSDGHLTSLIDNGTDLVHNWVAPASVFITTGNFTVGPDSSVYSITETGKLARIRNTDGIIIDSSVTTIFTNSYNVNSGLPSVEQRPRMVTGADGIVYISTIQDLDHRLAAYTADLVLIWEETANANGQDLYGVYGLALGDSVLAINARGTMIRAYKGRSITPTYIHKNKSTLNRINIHPNPTKGKITIEGENIQKIEIFNVTEKRILTVIVDNNEKEFIDMSEETEGVYFIRTTSNNVVSVKKLILQ